MDDPITELKELKETEGIKEYHAKLELIRARLRMSEEYLLSAYLGGLRLDTQMYVGMFHPTSTHECLVMGKLYEKAHPRRETKGTWSQSKSQYNHQKCVLIEKTDEGSKNKEEGGKQREENGKIKPFLSQA